MVHKSNLQGGLVVNWHLIVAAGDNEAGIKALVFVAMGILFFGLGIFGIVTKTVLLRARDQYIFAMFGVKKFSPGFAVFTGASYCLVGVLAFFAAISISMGYGLDKKGNVTRNGVPVNAAQRPVQPGPQPLVESKPVAGETPAERMAREAEDAKRREEREAERRRAEEDRQANAALRMRAQEEREAADRERERLAKELEEKTRREKEAARLAALELPKPPQSLGSISYVDKAVQESPLLGKANGARFIDRAPEGGVMVGAIFFIGDHFGDSVAGIQPIYQVGDEYVKGKICGNETDRPIQQLAESGGVVAGVKARIGLIMDSVQLAYGPLQGTKVDPKQGYFGDLIGSDGGSPKDFYAEGHSIAGIFGTYEQDKSLMSLGMYVIQRMQVSELPAKHEMRTFTSADGKFSVEAKLLKVNDDGTVSLEKADGSKISAPTASLSDDDRAYIRANQ